MRTSLLLTLTATLSVALLSGCNFGRKGAGSAGSGNYDPTQLPGGGFGSGASLIDIDGTLIDVQVPFPENPNLTLVSEALTGLETVYFAFDSSTLGPSELAKIERAGAYLKANPSHVILVEGHCDERGSAEYNLSLGEFRAQAVRNYLINLGIEGIRLQTRSFGSEKPAVIGTTESAYAQNRRALFAVYQ